jgi:hypothetical protein
MRSAPYGFRIVGSYRETRRLVDASAAFAGYAACVDEAAVNSQSYLSAFQFGEGFRRHLEMTGSTKGYDGLCWASWLWFDIDREDDIEAATRDTRRLAAFLEDRYRLDGDDLLVFFSGSKGYHIGLPTSLWQPEPSIEFNDVARDFARLIAEHLGVAIDDGVYDKVRAFRAPNSRHPKTGRYKRQMTVDELLKLKTGVILERACAPEPFDLPSPPPVNDLVLADWRRAKQIRAEATAANRQRQRARGGALSLNRQTLEFIRDGATKGDRHRLLFSAAANLAELGAPPALAHSLLTESALDSGLAPKDVRRQIECGLSSGQKSSAWDNGPESSPAICRDAAGTSSEIHDTVDFSASAPVTDQQRTGAKE